MLEKQGFSLIELLIVIAIIAVLAGLLFPVLSAAKASAKVETSKQYLRQQYIVINLYAQDNDDKPPTWDVVQNDPKMHAPCSPLDNWHTPCWSRHSPMLGSFGYIVPLASDMVPAVRNLTNVRPLLADPFCGHYKPGELDGDVIPDPISCQRSFICEFPERIWFVYTDGSLRVQRNEAPQTSMVPGVPYVRTLFTWTAVFKRQIDRDRTGGSEE